MSVSLYEPNYYKNFSCIASACRHSCCVGWQVRIDADAACRYRAIGGEMGKRLEAAMDTQDGETVFRLDEERRCPFLNEKGLCDIILTLGEGFLSEICTLHPRYRSCLSSRTELGIGIACEEAARLVLTQKEKAELLCVKEGRRRPHGFEKRLLAEREVLLAIATDRSLSFNARTDKLLAHIKYPADFWKKEAWLPVYRTLERLDGAFDTCLDLWEGEKDEICQSVGSEAEQLLVYFIWRHVTAAKGRRDLRARAAFCVLAAHHTLAIAAARGGTLTALIDTARLYSSEIEYSEENTKVLIDRCRAYRRA